MTSSDKLLLKLALVTAALLIAIFAIFGSLAWVEARAISEYKNGCVSEVSYYAPGWGHIAPLVTYHQL